MEGPGLEKREEKIENLKIKNLQKIKISETDPWITIKHSVTLKKSCSAKINFIDSQILLAKVAKLVILRSVS